jgi:hypothetical protein
MVIRSPGGIPHPDEPLDLALIGESGTCTPTSSKNEFWVYALGYTFCPEEGQYQAQVTFSAEGDEWVDETSDWIDIYDVDYDYIQEWCDCRFGGPGNWSIGGIDCDPDLTGTQAQCCCGDDPGELSQICQDGGSGVCLASSDNKACCSGPDECVFDGACHQQGESVLGTGCSNGIWEDSSPPFVEVYPAPSTVTSFWQNEDATAMVGCSDWGKPCQGDTYRLYVSDSEISSCPSQPGDYALYTYTSPLEIDARVWVCGAGMDYNGNLGFSGPVSFLVDEMAPAIIHDYAFDGVWVNTDQTVGFYPSDSGSVWGLEGLGGGGMESDTVIRFSGEGLSEPVSGEGEAGRGMLSFQSSLVEECAGGTDVSPCHVCEIQDMSIQLESPAGAPSAWIGLSKYSAGTCEPVNPEYYDYRSDTGYTFCPDEGQYTGTVTMLFIDGSSETLGPEPITGYYVSYDGDSNWCGCGYPGQWAMGGDVDPTTCCGDDAGENPRVCEESGIIVCSGSSDNDACCSDSGDCVYDGACHPDGYVMGVARCGMGVWRDSVSPVVQVVASPPSVTAVWQAASATASVDCTDVSGSCLESTYRLYISSSEVTDCPDQPGDYDTYYTHTSPQTITSHVWVCGAAMDDGGNTGFSTPVEFLVDLGLYDIESGIREVRICSVPQGDPACVPNTIISGPPYTVTFSTSMDKDVYYMAVDNAGNPSEIGHFNVRINKGTGPIVMVTGMPQDWTNQEQTAGVDCYDPFTGGGCTETDSYAMIVYPADPGACPQDEAQYTDPPPQAINEQAWVCAKAHASGMWGFSDPTWFTIETEPPSASLAPLPDWTNSTDIFTYFSVQWMASDTGGSGIESIGLQYSILDKTSGTYLSPVWRDWTPFPTESGSRDFGPLSPLNPGGYNNHTFLFRVNATDHAGNAMPYSDTDPCVNTSIDVVAPVCSIEGLSQYQTSISFTLTVNGAEGESGMENLTAEVMGPSDDTWVPILYKCLNETPIENAGSVDFTCTPGNDGTYLFRCRGKDRAGNTGGWSGTASTIVDTTPPIVQITWPDFEWSNLEDLRIEWSGSDTGTGIEHYNVSYYTTPWPGDSGGPWGIWNSFSSTTTEATFGQGGNPPVNLAEGTTYFIRLNATDRAGNEGQSLVINVTIDRTSPGIAVTATDQNGNPLESEWIPVGMGVTLINVTSLVFDGVSGVENNTIDFTVSGKSYEQGLLECGPGPPSGFSVCSTADSSQGREDIAYGEEASVRYRVKAVDRAGNINWSRYYFTVSHPLANFGSSFYHIVLGETALMPILVRNIQNSPDDVAVNLTGYQFAWFEHECEPSECTISGDRRGLEALGLNPYEERTYHVRIMSSEPGEYTLYLNASSSIDPGLMDNHSLSINVGYPVYFPGLGPWAVILLLVLAGFLYGWATREGS